MFRQRPSVTDKLNSNRPATMPVLTDLEEETAAPAADPVDAAPEPDTTEATDVTSTADTPARTLPSRKGTADPEGLPSLDSINQGRKGRAAQREKPARAPKTPKAPKAPKQATPVNRKKMLAAATAVTVLLAGGFVAVTQFAKPKATVAITNPDNEILMPQGPLPATPTDPAAQPAPSTSTDQGNPAQPAGQAQVPADATAPGPLTPPADLPSSPPKLPVTASMPSPSTAAPASPPVQMTGVPAKAAKPKPSAARMPDPFASADDAPAQSSAPTPPQALPAAVIPTPPRALPPVAAAPITLPVPTRVVATPPRALPVPPTPAALPTVPAIPLPAPVTMANPLETWVAEHELKFAAYAEGVTSQIILLSNVGSISVPLGSTIPQTNIKVSNLRPGAAATVTLTQGKYTLKLKIGGPQ
ncbi:hypothetical protein [Deinococcus soli (ex Cha et al. 2016)]|uniref:Uncharacterized protein n=2 Tax=Deinococcus soli (ex Cha et al. 2016) TaxID=1309411 RepID=A0ACC6KGF3_9DEIO|nr:hypothetical protein [Deinococcus soli (ex Cha et al. 2016)]MDR6218488.1 hypothetical protein [Deinococcus soli (ex Cha et al. 2016)]MDR6329228.1 hypothetical protein [Deinococcus soli (ex Cha et al. 2016)]MDR6751501.1 hypothetical protein [Deinococcus soli (ex Cha et al. 2016)]